MARFQRFPKIPDSLTPNLTERARRTRPCVTCINSKEEDGCWSDKMWEIFNIWYHNG